MPNARTFNTMMPAPAISSASAAQSRTSATNTVTIAPAVLMRRDVVRVLHQASSYITSSVNTRLAPLVTRQNQCL